MKVVVVGGGVAGMTSAYRLMQAGPRGRAVRGEPVPRRARAHVRGRRHAPRGLLPPHLLAPTRRSSHLIEELGLGDQLNWIESKVGWFADGKIYNFVTPLDLADVRPAAAPRPRAPRA